MPAPRTGASRREQPTDGHLVAGRGVGGQVLAVLGEVRPQRAQRHPRLDLHRHIRRLVVHDAVEAAQVERDVVAVDGAAEVQRGAAALRHDGEPGLGGRGEELRDLLAGRWLLRELRGGAVDGVVGGRAFALGGQRIAEVGRPGGHGG